ncbi:DUF5703 domain-containing protein [Cyclobacterium xiamenense]|uniref:DUF5703 domain-containing protein n=1 Tax=Cyclobacterium xiamenense TaxID=1297121 RepID=UPI0035CFB1F2
MILHQLTENMYVRALFVLSLFFLGQPVRAQLAEPAGTSSLPGLDACNVRWDTPSKNSLGSMPAGNGDIGINLWVEENGDLLFYLSKTDAWSANARLLKLGKVRLALAPNPFQKGNYFSQELILQDGYLRIEAGNPEERVEIEVWVDANHPVVELDVKSRREITASVTTEPWRLEQREIADDTEIHSAYGLQSVRVAKDTILDRDPENLVWAHRNEGSIWAENLKMQGLEGFITRGKDPLWHATFGALMQSESLHKSSPRTMETKGARTQFSVSIIALTEQTETLEDWEQSIGALAGKISSLSRQQRRKAHADWWQSFWERSYIFLSSRKDEEKDRVAMVSKNYNLQRYMHACSGRGRYPIKFNGSIFTVDTKHLDNRYGGFDADYRQWGGPYWWQNTRLPYWSMLEAGDFDLMQPLFRLYREILDIRKYATKTYYGHEGAFYLETMRHWGTFAESNYGVERPDSLPVGTPVNSFIRYYWQSGLEFSLMGLDYYAFTGDEETLKREILPVVTAVMTFFDQHWERDEQGKILFDPAMALETYQRAVNPLPEIVGIAKVCSELLALPESVLSEAQRSSYRRLLLELPEIPLREVAGEKRLAPAHAYSGKQNIENPELYAIFPYRRFGLGKDSLNLAIRTFTDRESRENRGWQQHSIKAAYLGLTEEAAELMTAYFNAGTTVYRFPTMWGPNYDWTPDQCHGSVAMIALQRMLLQYDRDEILLFPAWPNHWDVAFKLHAPQNTTVEGKLENGEITFLHVSPEKRREDVVQMFNR